MKKTFEDWLILSDVDGTLHNKLGGLPQRNYEAIRKFTELGGNFTLASGRTVTCITPAYESVPCNQPAVILNGAAIYDMKNHRLLSSTPIGEKGMQFVREVVRRFSGTVYSLDVAIYCADMVYIVRSGMLSQLTLSVDKSPCKTADIDRVPQEGWLRVIFWGTPQVLRWFSHYIESVPNPDANFMFSSSFTVEMLQKDVHKGTGALKLARELGIRRDHVAGIGDYYNDWDMLKTVGLPACAGQAPRKIQSICKYKACHCNRGCVADLIEFIMFRGGGLPQQ